MNIYIVRDSHPDRVLNTRYFWIDTERDVQDPASDLANVLLVSNDWKFASYQGKSAGFQRMPPLKPVSLAMLYAT